MERRIQAVLSLKNSITSNRVLLLWLSWGMKKLTYLMLSLKARKMDCNIINKQLGLMFLITSSYRAFREQQKSRKIEIVSKILQEKASIFKQKNQQSCTKAIKSGGKCKDSLLQRKKTWRYIEKTCKRAAGISKEEMDTKHLAPRTMKTEILEEKKEEFQTRIFNKGTLSGYEHQGRTFYTKPSCVHFKDFDVGKIYKKKIVLINASYSINYCKPVGISEWLKDFITIQFDPPGKMSAGMSCEVGVTFKPVINENLEGEVMFMAQTGSFSVPLKCTAKTCTLALDKVLVDFGTHVVGERISRAVILTNTGALGTRFKVQTSAGDSSRCGATAESSTTRTVEIRVQKVVLSIYGFYLSVKDSTKQLLRVTEGEIGPFSSVKLQIIFMPSIPGDVRAEFVIMFDNSDCKPLYFTAIGVSVDVPVWVPNPNIDLKICMYDRLYQDCIVIRTKTMLHLKFEVCKELSKHMKLLPKTGCIQPRSSFSVQLKFLPRRSLPEDAGSCFNEETSVLEAPVMVQITKQINFTVHAIVTTSDLEISPAEINFGYCTIYEAVRTNVTLTNKSILPQEFGFVRLPEFVEIQPNDGLGVLLPLESLTLHIIFKANKAEEYSFELTCKSEVNRQFKLSCRAVGVHPPLELSHSLVQFAATALNDVSTATLYVMNSHVSANLFSHAVPRIGNGEVAPVGPTSFEFYVPEDCPVAIKPSVGTVLPGKKSLIQVSFRPTLSDQLIREEAAQRLCEAAATGHVLLVYYFQIFVSLDGIFITKLFPQAYIAAQAFLTRNFRGRFEKYTIPCFVASGDIDEKRGLESLSFSPYNTLYLELHCPAVAPSVVVTSDNGKNTVDFGNVAVGQTILKQTTLQNISPEKLELRFSVLNPSGPFLLVRPVRMLEPGEIRTLVISFSPNEDKLFFEMLHIQTVKNNLPLRITGYGVMPSIICSVEEVLDMGYVLTREKATSTFKVKPLVLNQGSVSTVFIDRRKSSIVPRLNYNGLSVFSVLPTEGEILAGESQDFTVTFSPEHEGLYYSECLKVVLFGKKTAHVIQLKGAARDHPMYVEGGIPLDVPVESLAVTSPLSSKKTRKEELQEPVKSILLLLEHVEGENALLPAVTELKVGAIQTAQFASKKVKKMQSYIRCC
uniref:Cilia and flagella associated protein 74 n=1 Tax=Phasianus colchicus TaxID=9054 RepID=A0A669R0W6_PHACC